jgi:hypothetical protein
MDQEQKSLLAEKIMDAGNLAVAALTFGSLVGTFNLWVLILGLAIFVAFYLLGLKLKGG